MDYIKTMVNGFHEENLIVKTRYNGDLDRYKRDIFINFTCTLIIIVIQYFNSVLAGQSIWWVSNVTSILSVLVVFAFNPPFLTQDPVFLGIVMVPRLIVISSIVYAQLQSEISLLFVICSVLAYDSWYIFYHFGETQDIGFYYSQYFIILIFIYLTAFAQTFVWKTRFL